jgi:hypothetical protein
MYTVSIVTGAVESPTRHTLASFTHDSLKLDPDELESVSERSPMVGPLSAYDTRVPMDGPSPGVDREGVASVSSLTERHSAGATARASGGRDAWPPPQWVAWALLVAGTGLGVTGTVINVLELWK